MRSIGIRLFLAFSCIVVLLLVQAGLAIYSARNLSNVQRHAMESELAIKILKEEIAEARLAVVKLLGTMNPAEMDRNRDEFEERIELATQQMQALELPSRPMEESRATYEEIIRLHYDFSVKSARDLLNDQSKRQYEALSRFLDAEFARVADDAQALVQSANSKSIGASVGLCLIALIVASIWAFVLKNSLTDRKHAEAALRESKEHLAQALDITGASIWMLDLKTNEFSIDTKISESLYYERDEFPDTYESMLEFIHPSDVDDLRAGLNACAQGKTERFAMEHRVRAKDGSWKWFHSQARMGAWDHQGNPIRMIGTTIEITEYKNAIEELRQSEEKFRALAENSPDVIMRFDRQHRHLYASPAVEGITGIPSEAFIGKTHAEMNLPTDLCEFWEAKIETVFKTAQPIETQFEMESPDGHKVVYWQLIPEFALDGSVMTVLSTSRDISERIQLENQLRQSQKMDAIGQLAGGIAHDFNNLLQAIQGYTDLAIDSLESEHPAKDSLGQVMKASMRASSLVQQLLTFSRREMIKRKYLDLNDAIGDLLKMVRRVIGEHIELVINSAEELRTVYADPGQLQQVLINLCVNARDAMPQGGKITIETGNVFIDREYRKQHPWAKPGQFVLLSVSDTGVGIPPETIEHIFEPFFTTKDVGEGTGLGLATVYGIVKQHDGMIDVHSEIDRGAVFQIYFPAVEDTAHEIEEKRKEVGVSRGNETILLAEDEEQVRELVMKVLEYAGYRVIVARNGEEAIEQFKKHADRIDMALLDVMMPIKSGRAACDAIRALNPNLPVLFSSGYSRQHLEAEFQPQEKIQLIQKPVSPNELLKKLREMLDQKK